MQEVHWHDEIPRALTDRQPGKSSDLAGISLPSPLLPFPCQFFRLYLLFLSLMRYTVHMPCFNQNIRFHLVIFEFMVLTAVGTAKRS
jgi:hypothetical protein